MASRRKTNNEIKKLRNSEIGRICPTVWYTKLLTHIQMKLHNKSKEISILMGSNLYETNMPCFKTIENYKKNAYTLIQTPPIGRTCENEGKNKSSSTGVKPHFLFNISPSRKRISRERRRKLK